MSKKPLLWQDATILLYNSNLLISSYKEKLTAASTGTSWPARSLVRRGVIIIAPIVEHLQILKKILYIKEKKKLKRPTTFKNKQVNVEVYIYVVMSTESATFPLEM